jgi:uncharacterized membrane protein/thiol-disulfide isomerase/thioredoxin
MGQVVDGLRAVRRGRIRGGIALPLLLLLVALSPAIAGAQEAAVRVIFFFSPRCPHCHVVMDEHLPPLMARYPDALRIVAVNVDTPEGQALYAAVARHFALGRDRRGVPALVVGDRMLVGSAEIPALLPHIVERGLAAGGIGWPAIPEVAVYLAGARAGGSDGRPADGARVAGGALALSYGAGPAGRGPVGTTVGERYRQDPVGNSLAALVLLAMLAVAVLAAKHLLRPAGRIAAPPDWVVPALAAAGAGVAAYLAFVEVTATAAVCGPIGDCNAVQASPYAEVYGVPVGVLGLIGYAVIGGAWLVARRAAGAWRQRGMLALWALAFGGVLFSMYLTFLEPFVIGATCIWCLNSAVIMTLLLVAVTPGAGAAIRRRRPARAGQAPAQRMRQMRPRTESTT